MVQQELTVRTLLAPSLRTQVGLCTPSLCVCVWGGGLLYVVYPRVRGKSVRTVAVALEWDVLCFLWTTPGGWSCVRVCASVCAGPTVTEFLLLETAASFGLSDALQDAVAGAIGDAALIPLAQVKDLLVGAGVGLAAAKRIVGRLVRCAAASTRSCML